MRKNTSKFIILLIFCTFIIIPQSTEAQDSEFDLPRKSLQYEKLNENNIKYVQIVQKTIMLDSRANKKLARPEQTKNNRFSLIDLLLYGINKRGIHAYTPNNEEYFDYGITLNEIRERFGVTEEIAHFENPETGEIEEHIIKKEINSSEIREYLIKELQFFDYNNNLIQSRPLWICPIRYYNREDGDGGSDVVKKKIAWFYIPEIRKLLSEYRVGWFNSYDDFISYQKYSAEISEYYSYIDNNEYITEYKLPVTKEIALFHAKNDYETAKNSYKTAYYPDNKVVAYKKMDEKEVSVAKYQYRHIKLSDPKNEMIGFPTNPIKEIGFSSLSNLIFHSIRYNEINAYSPNDENQILTFEELKEQMGANDIPIFIEDIETGELEEHIILRQIQEDEITEYLIKEIVFYNKKGEIIQIRIAGFIPIRTYYREDDIDHENMKYKRIAFISYPEIQKILADNYIFDQKNLIYQSYDSFFTNRNYKGKIKNYPVDTTDYLVKLMQDTVAYQIFPVYPEAAFKLAEMYAEIDSNDNPVKSNYSTKIVIPEKPKFDKKESFYSKIVYSKININDVKNFNLGLPLYETNRFNNLADLIMKAIKKSNIKAYQADSLFRIGTAISIEKALVIFGQKRITFIDEYENEAIICYNSEEIQSYLIKEKQYFNENNELLYSEIEALAPIRHFSDNDMEQQEQLTFWLKFDEMKIILRTNLLYEVKSYHYQTFYEFFIHKNYRANVIKEEKIK